MTSLRRVRETLNALKGELAPADQGPLIVWVDHHDGETHADAVARTLAEKSLTGDEPGLMLISWRHPEHVEATESTGARP